MAPAGALVAMAVVLGQVAGFVAGAGPSEACGLRQFGLADLALSVRPGMSISITSPFPEADVAAAGR